MTDEQIRQNAEEYAKKHYDIPFEDDSSMNVIVSEESYIAGAHSRDEDIKLLKIIIDEQSYLIDTLTESKKKLIKERKELKKSLNNAVSLLYDILGDDDFFCTMLLDIDEEAKICEKCCDNLNEKCILRYLKHYKKGE